MKNTSHKRPTDNDKNKQLHHHFYSELLIPFACLIIPIITFTCCDFFVSPYVDHETISNITPTIASIVATMVAIIFSVTLLVMERVASKYSPRFLRHVLHNGIFIIAVSYSAALILFCLFTTNTSHYYTFRIILTAFSFFICLFVITIKEAAALLNPYESILRPEEKRITKWLQITIAKTEKAINESVKMLPKQNTAIINSLPMPVPGNIEEELERRLLPIRDIIIRAINDNNLQEARDGIEVFTNIAFSYLRARHGFTQNSDALFSFIHTEYQNIAAVANSTKHMHLRIHPIIIESLGNISMEALKIPVKNYGVSSNDLIIFPTMDICSLCLQNLKNEDSHAPAIAISTITKIGFAALEEGYIDTSISMVEELFKISNLILNYKQLNLCFLSHRANMRALQLTCSIISGNELKSEVSYYSIRPKIFRNMQYTIMNCISKWRTEFSFDDPLSPFLSNFYELQSNNKISLASIVASMVFVQNSYKSLDLRLDLINSDIYSVVFTPTLNTIKDTDQIRLEKVVDTLYVSQLVLLSLFDANLRQSVLGSTYKNINIEVNTEKALSVFRHGISILWERFLRSNNKTESNNHILDAIFSILLICTLSDSMDAEVAKVAKSTARQLLDEYSKISNSSQDIFFKYCRAFNTFSGEQRAVLQRIPKYNNIKQGFNYYGRGDYSLPFDDMYDAMIPESIEQWHLLGSFSLNNNFLERLNKKMWSKATTVPAKHKRKKDLNKS